MSKKNYTKSNYRHSKQKINDKLLYGIVIGSAITLFGVINGSIETDSFKVPAIAIIATGVLIESWVILKFVKTKILNTKHG